MANNIQGKVIVITEAASGIGAASARLLNKQGAKLVLGACRVDKYIIAIHRCNETRRS
ncbi:hypothetical protein QMO72_13180 [Staphylococcus casei]|uniref:hypothetical protein n=1 Tax=Staphylococcus TaxID=1279 RepID=UPI00257004CE|nr:hypothetical protein [Staphylococcus casei]WJE86324.1 hypothetical protein QMO72_13180 [Staphylococcus casei]